MTQGNRHDSTFFRARELAEWGVSKKDADAYFSQFKTDDADSQDIQRQVDNAYKKTLEQNKFGTAYKKI